ncbi:MAG: VWA domain-containing protein [Candidatus Acidiferrales bacterium]
MRRGSMLVLGAALFVTVPFATLPQQQTQQAPAATPVDNKILLDVVVAPKSGGAVPGLTQPDFTVLDNGAPQTIASFRAISGREAEVESLIVIDAVNTGVNNVNYARNELEKFLKSESGALAHPTAIAVLTDTGIQTLGPFSTEGTDLNAQVDKSQIALRSLTRSGGFYGAAERDDISLRALGGISVAETQRNGRKLVLFLSPGWALLSGANVELDKKQEQQVFSDIVTTSANLMRARITLYAVDPLGTTDAGMHSVYYKSFLKGVTKLSDVHFGALALQVLAEQSGGLALSESNDVAAEIRRCLADADNYYEISYVPPASTKPNEFHKIDVKIAKPALIARTRMGYYSQP